MVIGNVLGANFIHTQCIVYIYYEIIHEVHKRKS